MDTVADTGVEQLRLLDGNQYRFTLQLYSGEGDLTLYQEIKGYRVPMSLKTIVPPSSFANGYVFHMVEVTPDGMKSLLKVVETEVQRLKDIALVNGLPEHASKKRRR